MPIIKSLFFFFFNKFLSLGQKVNFLEQENNKMLLKKEEKLIWWSFRFQRCNICGRSRLSKSLLYTCMRARQEHRWNVQPVRRELQLKPRVESQEKDRGQHHHQPAGERGGEPQLPGVLLLPLPPVRVSHEQTQDRHREGECGTARSDQAASVTFSDCRTLELFVFLRHCVLVWKPFIGQWLVYMIRVWWDENKCVCFQAMIACRRVAEPSQRVQVYLCRVMEALGEFRWGRCCAWCTGPELWYDNSSHNCSRLTPARSLPHGLYCCDIIQDDRVEPVHGSTDHWTHLADHDIPECRAKPVVSALPEGDEPAYGAWGQEPVSALWFNLNFMYKSR